jgi:hypothetical protein
VSIRLASGVIGAMLCGTLAARAEDRVIGIAVTSGQLQVDRATVVGNANLREGSHIATADAAARIQLAGGVRATLGLNSEARVHAGRMELARGAGLVAAPEYRLVAGGYSVHALAGAQAQVYRQGDSVDVAAVNGAVLVRDNQGLLLAKVTPAQPLRFEPGTPGISSMTGVLRHERGEYRLQDEVTNLDVVLRGENLDRHSGRRVQVSGSAAPEGDSQVIQVARLSREAAQQTTGAAKPTATGAAKPGAKAPSSTRSGGGAGGGMSAGAKIGLIAAIGGGGAAAALLLGGGDSGSPSISR